MENVINNLNELAPLYDEFFIIGGEEKNSPKETEKINKSANFLGGYKSRILMIYNAAPSITAQDREMVHNLVVNAIKISWDDIAFFNVSENPGLSYSDLLESLMPEKVLCWGCDDYLNAGTAKYEVLTKGNMKELLADEIAQYHESRELKVKLWTSVQQLLGLV